MRTASLSAVASTAAAVAAVSARNDYSKRDQLSARTQLLMWPAYVLGAATIASSAGESIGEGDRSSRIAGAALAAAGATLFAAGVRPFASFSQLVGRESGTLITDGVYRVSRNPQYLGNVLLASGAAIAARSLPGSLFAAGGAVAYSFYLPAEEAHLERVFGDDYRRYLQRSPRWLGFPLRRSRPA